MSAIQVDLDQADEYSISIENGQITGVLMLSLCDLADKIDKEVDCETIITGLPDKTIRDWLQAIKDEDEDAMMDFMKEELSIDVAGMHARTENLEFTMTQLADHLQAAGVTDKKIQGDMKEMRWQLGQFINLVNKADW